MVKTIGFRLRFSLQPIHWYWHLQEWLGCGRLRGQLQWLCSLNRWGCCHSCHSTNGRGCLWWWNTGEIRVKSWLWCLWWWNTSFYTAISLWNCGSMIDIVVLTRLPHYIEPLKKTRCSKQANTNWNLENRQQKGTWESHENLLISPKTDSWGVPVPSLLVNGKAKHWRTGDSSHSTVVGDSYIVHGWQ